MTRALEHCRHWDAERGDRCNERATIIVWGKLYDRDLLGPRCSRHWPPGYGEREVSDGAIFDLRPFMHKAGETA